MRKFVWLITMCVVGLGGYYLGQQPNSPRIFEPAFSGAEQFEASGGSEWVSEKMQAGRRSLVAFLSSSKSESSEGLAAERVVSPAQRSSESEPIPRCW